MAKRRGKARGKGRGKSRGSRRSGGKARKTGKAGKARGRVGRTKGRAAKVEGRSGSRKKGGKRIDWDKIRWGSLTEWLLRHREEIRERYGKDPFTKTGEINDNVLRRLYRDKEFLRELAGSHADTVWHKIHFKLHVLNKAHGG